MGRCQIGEKSTNILLHKDALYKNLELDKEIKNQQINLDKEKIRLIKFLLCII